MTKLALRLTLAAILALALVDSLPVATATESEVTAAAAGVFPPGATFDGLPLQGSTFGLGVVIYPNGTAVGDLDILLAGTSPLGQPQDLRLEGKVSSGTVNADGSVTFSGTGTLTTENGSVQASVPFRVAATTSGLQLTVAASVLPTQTLSAGSIFIR